MRLRLLLLASLTAVAALLPAVASAKTEIGPPREIATTVGEAKSLRLMSNAAKDLHWVWLRKPNSAIAKPYPPEMLPENDEAVNGLSGRTAITVRGVKPGTTSAKLGYFTRDGKTLLKTVVVRVIVT